MDFAGLKRLVTESANIVFFGGAGTSTESGIPDFRSEAGLYRTTTGTSHPPEEMLSLSFFLRHPDQFYDFYKTKLIYKDARPNAAHHALVELENRGKLAAIITQNIDGLHQMAGNRNVLELHGSVYRNYCMKCRKFFGLDDILASPEPVPTCDRCKGIIKPDVVLYEENLDSGVLEQAARHITEADVLIVGGTSLSVYPAAGLIRYYRGNKMILINQSPTPFDGLANYVIHDSIGKVLNALVF